MKTYTHPKWKDPEYRKDYQKAYRQKNKKKLRAYYVENREKLLAAEKRRYKERDPVARAEYRRAYYEANRERAAQRQKEYDKRNLSAKLARNMARRADKQSRIPAWADTEAINLFYRNCPDGFHVDHIVPLKGENVSGLHVIENLQYLTARENLQKGNRF